TTLRLADSDTVPFEFSNFAETVGQYANEVTRLADTMRDETKASNYAISNGMWPAVQDPKEKLITPKVKDAVPYLNFAPLQNAVQKLQASAANYKSRAGGSSSAELDQVLYKTERALTRSAGLPRRDWFRHQIYAPGFYTGYGVKTLPGIREAIEQRNWKEAEEQIGIAAATIERFAAEIDRASKLYP
ncbi:MAG: folate hydrolase, partial [Acidobacteria bacterium]|nr:folate hydrolase [Acidobacteriota bacterium]